jgi:hypothetical protein
LYVASLYSPKTSHEPKRCTWRHCIALKRQTRNIDNSLIPQQHRRKTQPSSYEEILSGVVTRLKRRVSLVEQELPTLREHLSSPPVLVTRSLVLCVMFCRSLIVLLSLFVWPWCCLSFDLRILINPLISSNSF